MRRLYLLLLHAPAPLYILISLASPSCANHGFCGFLGSPFPFNARTGQPFVGDVLVACAIAGTCWLLASAVLLRCVAPSEERRLGAALLVAHALTFCGAYSALTSIIARQTADAIDVYLPKEFLDLRAHWRALAGGLRGSVGMVPVRTYDEGVACEKLVRLGGVGVSGVGDGSKVVFDEAAARWRWGGGKSGCGQARVFGSAAFQQFRCQAQSQLPFLFWYREAVFGPWEQWDDLL